MNKKFKNKLNNNEFVYGVFMKTSDPMLVEIAGIANFDFVILDTEHGPTDIEHQQNNIRACEVRNILPIVRVPKIDEEIISKSLDIGAQGVQISQVRTVEDVRKIVRCVRFYPYGERGVCRFVRAADYSNKDRKEYFASSKELLIILQLEGVEAIKNLDEILNEEGYDIIFIGPYDLSQSLGVPGEIKHPIVLTEMINIVQKAKEKGKIVGTFTDDKEMVNKWKNLGVQYISHSTDSGLFLDKLKSTKKMLLENNFNKKINIYDSTLFNHNFFTKKQCESIRSALIKSNIEYIEYPMNLFPQKNKKSNIYFSIKYCDDLYEKIKNIDKVRIIFNKNNFNNILDCCNKLNLMQKEVMIFLEDIMSFSESELINIINNIKNIKGLFIEIKDRLISLDQIKNKIIILSKMLDNKIPLGICLKSIFNSHLLVFESLKNIVDRELIIETSLLHLDDYVINTLVLIDYYKKMKINKYNNDYLLMIYDKFLIKKTKKKKYYNWNIDYLTYKYEVNDKYIKYLEQKNTITLVDIEKILKSIPLDFKDFKVEYIENLYLSYLETKDTNLYDINVIKTIFNNKNVVVICPGTSSKNVDKIKKYIDNNTIIVSVNFNYSLIETDYIFVGNNKRILEIDKKEYNKIIATTNIPNNNVFAKVNYSSLLNNTEYVRDNSGLMLLKLLTLCNVERIVVVGMDGYKYDNNDNYLRHSLILDNEKDTIDNLNYGMKVEIQSIKKNANIQFIK